MTIHDYSTGELPGADDPQWDTRQLQEDFEVTAFAAPFVIVRRKSDGQTGTLQFNHNPRIYFNFQPDNG
jgi:hypothetical protein